MTRVPAAPGQRLEELVDLGRVAGAASAWSLRHSPPSRRFSSTVSSAITPRPSGTCAMPRRTSCSHRHAAQVLPSSRIWPALGRIRPESVRSRVVLPAPLAPSDGGDGAGGTVRSMSCSTGAAPYPAPARAPRAGRSSTRCRGDRGHHVARPPRPGRPRRPPGRRAISAGVPVAITRPKSSTTISSQTRITRSMWCSTSRTAQPSARPGRCRTSSASSSMSSAPRPPAGSSSSSRRGRRPARGPGRPAWRTA